MTEGENKKTGDHNCPTAVRRVKMIAHSLIGRTQEASLNTALDSDGNSGCTIDLTSGEDRSGGEGHGENTSVRSGGSSSTSETFRLVSLAGRHPAIADDERRAPMKVTADTALLACVSSFSNTFSALSDVLVA